MAWSYEDRRIIDSTGGGRGCVFNYGVELSNGDLLFSGIIRSGLDFATSQRESWIVKTDSNGCLTPGCQDTFQILVASKEAPGYREPDIFGLLPNPFSDRLVLGTLLGYVVPPGDYAAAVVRPARQGGACAPQDRPRPADGLRYGGTARRDVCGAGAAERSAGAGAESAERVDEVRSH